MGFGVRFVLIFYFLLLYHIRSLIIQTKVLNLANNVNLLDPSVLDS